MDIQYTQSYGNVVSVRFDVSCRQESQYRFTANTLSPVAASPSGETVLAEYSFTEKAPMGDVSSLITWSTTYVSSSSGMKVYRDGNKLVF